MVKNTKLTPLIVVSMFLLILSLGAILLFSYNFFYKKSNDNGNDSAHRNTTTTTASTTTGETVQMVSDSSQAKLLLSGEVSEYIKLQNQVNSLLEVGAGITPGSAEDSELDIRLQKLRQSNLLIAEENRKFGLKLNTLSEDLKKLRAMKPAIADTQAVVTPPVVAKEEVKEVPKPEVKEELKEEKKEEKEKTVKLNMLASDMNISARQMDGDVEKETNDAKQASKLVCSAWLENVGNSNISKAVTVEILKPGGKLMQRTSVRVDVPPGEQKKVNFTLPAYKLKPGRYTLQLVFQGEVIGIGSKFLQ